MVENLRRQCRQVSGTTFVAVLAAYLLVVNFIGGLMVSNASTEIATATAVASTACVWLTFWIVWQPRKVTGFVLLTLLTGLPISVAAIFGGGPITAIGVCAAVLTSIFLYVKFCVD